VKVISRERSSAVSKSSAVSVIAAFSRGQLDDGSLASMEA
jgi:hypothetical protein